MGLGSDATFVITEIHNGVAPRLEDKINPFILSIYCVVHITNIPSLDAISSAHYKKIIYFAW